MSDSGRDVPPLYRGIAEAAKTSRAASLKLFCLECVGYVRADVTNCTARQCPLHPWRPYQAKTDRKPGVFHGRRPPTRADHHTG